MADLITLAEYKARAGIDATDTRNDARITAVIPAVTAAIKNFTERDFASTVITEQRTFEYDGSGFLDIDDCTSITEVRFTRPNVADIILDAETWYGAPTRRDDSPVFYYIVLTTPLGFSPHMGFTRNLDVLYHEGRLPSVTRTALVTATWGWPDVPEDVKQAAVWTIQGWVTGPQSSGGENLTSEAIEGYSRSWGNRSSAGVAAALAIPNLARDILVNYQKKLV